MIATDSGCAATTVDPTYHNLPFTDCGTNIAYLYYCDLAGRTVTTLPPQREGIHWLDFNRDLGSFLRKRRRGELSTGQWLRSLLSARSFAYFDPRDPIPALGGALLRSKSIADHLVRRFVGSSKGGVVGGSGPR